MTTAANCSAYPSKVPTSNVFISNVNGTSSGKKKGLVVDLACSPGNQTCTNIHLDNAGSLDRVHGPASSADLCLNRSQ